MIALILAATLVGPPPPNHDARWLISGATLDLAGTEYVLRSQPGHFTEGNPLPLAQYTAGRVAFKALSVGAVWLVCRELRKDGHPTAAKWVARVGGSAWGLAGVTNVIRSKR